MQNSDEQLLKDFFYASKAPVNDQGFTQRVMRSLPQRSIRWERLWNVTGCIALLILFINLNGFRLICDTLQQVVMHLFKQSMTTTDPYSLLIAGVILLILTYRKIASMV